MIGRKLIGALACVPWLALAAPASPQGRPGMGPLWEKLAHAHVLVRVVRAGAELKGGHGTGRFACEETLRALDAAIAADPSLPGRIHELRVDASSSGPKVEVHQPPSADRPVSLWLLFRARPDQPLEVPDAAQIRSALAPLPPRPRLAQNDFDERFALFLAGAGLGLAVMSPAHTDIAGAPAFHAALKALGDAVAHPLPGYQEALRARVDPRAMMQVALRESSAPDAGFRPSASAEFPGYATTSSAEPFVAYTLAHGQVSVPDLAALEAKLAPWLVRWRAARGKPEERALADEPTTLH